MQPNAYDTANVNIAHVNRRATRTRRMCIARSRSRDRLQTKSEHSSRKTASLVAGNKNEIVPPGGNSTSGPSGSATILYIYEYTRTIGDGIKSNKRSDPDTTLRSFAQSSSASS